MEVSSNINVNNATNLPNVIHKDHKLTNLEGLPINFFKQNRDNFIKNLKQKYPQYEKDSLLLLEGGKEIPRYDTDTPSFSFIQESNFYYLSGVLEPNFNLIFDFTSESIVLFKDSADLVTKIFCRVLSNEEVKQTYGAECYDTKEMLNFIAKRNAKVLYTLKGTNTDSGLNYKGFEFPENIIKEAKENEKNILQSLVPSEDLFEYLVDTRTRKTEDEISIMKFSSEVTVDAHKMVLKAMKPGINERDLENVFFGYLRSHYYHREYAYHPICGCGVGGATLHYQKNDITLVDGEMVLFDMGFRIGGYCSDVTSTAPVNGKFTERQKHLYDAVLRANRAVIDNLKAGVNWTEMHILSEKICIEALQKAGLLSDNYSVDEMTDSRVAFYFQPHGLGHLIGLDVHDHGGYLSFTNPRSTEPGKRSLRTARILEAGTVVTVEPGIYIIEFHLENAFKNEKVSKYFNIQKCREYYGFGGIRIEDVVLVQDKGCYNFCKNLPRTTEEIEKCMANKD